jgi:hypothetical protein
MSEGILPQVLIKVPGNQVKVVQAYSHANGGEGGSLLIHIITMKVVGLVMIISTES